jgi:hypothetical protein
MDKTILEFLEELPEPQRSEALANAKNPVYGCEADKEFGGLARLVPSARVALSSAFVWSLSPQGFEYWRAQQIRP